VSDLVEAATPPGGLRAASGLLSHWALSAGLALLGLLDAAYLAWIKLANATYACSNIGDCETVNRSSYSEVAGIPIAALGAAAYGVILLLVLLDRRPSQRSEPFRFGVFGLALAGTLYSAYLTYVEVAVLRAICPYCVASALILTALLGLSLVRLRALES
jgi:uncharacterized membrane protein